MLPAYIDPGTVAAKRADQTIYRSKRALIVSASPRCQGRNLLSLLSRMPANSLPTCAFRRFELLLHPPGP